MAGDLRGRKAKDQGAGRGLQDALTFPYRIVSPECWYDATGVHLVYEVLTDARTPRDVIALESEGLNFGLQALSDASTAQIVREKRAHLEVSASNAAALTARFHFGLWEFGREASLLAKVNFLLEGRFWFEHMGVAGLYQLVHALPHPMDGAALAGGDAFGVYRSALANPGGSVVEALRQIGELK